jgi:hypothetical protein
MLSPPPLPSPVLLVAPDNNERSTSAVARPKRAIELKSSNDNDTRLVYDPKVTINQPNSSRNLTMSPPLIVRRKKDNSVVDSTLLQNVDGMHSSSQIGVDIEGYLPTTSQSNSVLLEPNQSEPAVDNSEPSV